MRIYVDESPMGSGKTHRAIHEIASTPSKTLFITERIDRFDELARDIRAAAAERGTNPRIERVHHDPKDTGNSVSSRIEALPQVFAKCDHLIVLATHAALLRSDFSQFQGWQLVVDEVPQFLDFEQKGTHLDAQFFQKHYRLDPFADGWSVVTLTPAGAAITPANLRACQSHEHLAVFHRRVEQASRPDATRYVMCNLPEWEAMSDDRVKWCWASAFSLWELEAFDRIVMLGNRFRRDIGTILSERMSIEPIEWVTLPNADRGKQFVHRRVHINYFSDTRQASRSLFESADGQRMLKEIGSHLAQALSPDGFIWSANATVATPGCLSAQDSLQVGGLCGEGYLPPRQAGTNSYRRTSNAAIIYSAKASPNLRGLLGVLGILEETWAKSVEHETICQFMTRTSLRDPDNASPVHLWVFDREQARYLLGYLDGLSHVTATVRKAEDGPAIPVVGTPGRKCTVRTPEEQAEYQAEKRRKDAERKRRKRAEARALERLRKAA